MKNNHRYCSLFLLIFFFASPCHGRNLIFGTHPFSNPAAIHKLFEPLVTYLTKETGVKISIRIAPNYLAHIKALGEGRVDLGFAGPSPYVQIHDKYGGIELLAKVKIKEDKNDKIVIFCRRDAPYQSIKDLKGTDFAFGDPQSFGSHFMPRWLLDRHGLTPHDLRTYAFVNSHDNVVLSVLHGDFAAGGARLDVYEKYKDRPLRVLAGPFPIPPHVLVCRKELPREIKETLRRALFGLRDPVVLKQINEQLLGFSKVKDGDFDQARRVMEYIESR